MRQGLRAVLLCLVVWSVLPGHAEAQDRMVIATDVACRDQPAVTSPAVTLLRVGDRLTVADRRTVEGADWYLASGRTPAAVLLDPSRLRGRCWVYGPLTVEFSLEDPGAALTAAADRVLERQEAAFEELVAVENLFGWEPFAAATAASGRLQVRRLRIIDRAAWRLRVPLDPLAQAWLLARRDMLARSAFSHSWHLRPDVYWTLYAQHEGTAAADDIAWAAAHAVFPRDECYTACILNLVTETDMQYWTRFPDGRFVSDALARAAAQAEYASRFCILAAAPDYAYMGDGSAGESARRLRESVERVTAPERESLLAHLANVEQRCTPDAAAGLDDPRAIPGLAHALGLGFRVIREALVAFGEDAVPDIIDVATSPERRRDAGDALTALRFIVERSATTPLSDATLADIRRTAEQWLMEDQQSVLTLGSAIDLAAVLGDPELRRIVESLAADPDEVISRGVDDPPSVLGIQRRAADRLAGVPPLPRP